MWLYQSHRPSTLRAMKKVDAALVTVLQSTCDGGLGEFRIILSGRRTTWRQHRLRTWISPTTYYPQSQVPCRFKLCTSGSGSNVKPMPPLRPRSKATRGGKHTCTSRSVTMRSSASSLQTIVGGDCDSKAFSTATAHRIPKSFAIGSLAGLLGSLCGMGGGFVMIPLMTSPALLNVTQHAAHGTSLFAVAATGIAGAIGYGISENVDIDVAASLALCGMVTARVGAATTSRMSGSSLKRALGMFMLFVAPIVPAKGFIVDKYGVNLSTSSDERWRCNDGKERRIAGVTKDCENRRSSSDELVSSTVEIKTNSGPAGDRTRFKMHATGITNNMIARRMSIQMRRTETLKDRLAVNRLFPPAVIGLGSGFLAGMFGVGGGAIVVPALAVFTDMTHHQALGTSLLAMTLPAAVGTLTHYKAGNVALRLAFPLALGSFVGAYAGGKIGLAIPEEKLRYGFSALMVTLGTKSILRA